MQHSITLLLGQIALTQPGVVLSHCPVGKAFQGKLVERMPKVCKAVNKEKGGYIEESKIYFDLFNTFLVTT